MATIFTTIRGWFFGGNALAERPGEQRPLPGAQLVADTAAIGVDAALQIASVWACVNRRAAIVASLPLFVYARGADGHKDVNPARDSRLYSLLHDSPNARMTPFEFWRAMMLNHDLRGNAYARIDRDPRTGEALALWPMPADQVQHAVLDDGSVIYTYTLGHDVAVFDASSVLHLKDLGNGTSGLPKLEYMRCTTDEAAKAQQTATKLFGTSGKPTGVLMIDNVLRPAQREAIRQNFADMSTASTGRLYVLEANMKYQQLSLSPEDQQLLESRQFNIEEICRWFDVPPVMVYHSNVTTWGSGVEAILDGWYKVSLGPLVKNIEQAITKRVLTPAQRARHVVEFNLDALLRGNAKDRAELYAKLVQNGILTRNEARQLENLPSDPDGDVLTAQTNLSPLAMLGKEQPANSAPPPEPTLQSAFARERERERVEAKAAADEAARTETLALLRALATREPPQVNVTNHVPEAKAPVITIENKGEAMPAPVVNVVNQVQPTPVEVSVRNDVAPTPVDVTATFEATVQPAAVELALPNRKTVTDFTRDGKGQIVRATQTETDA